MKPLIYSVEDDLNIQNVIKIALKNSNFEVEMFDNAKSMFETLKNKKPNLLLLDVMLPDMDGIEILKKLKLNPRFQNIPVMMLSAKSNEIDKVIGLDFGADDYMTKPFGVLELVSRIKALLRRFNNNNSDKQIVINDLVLTPKKYKCEYKDKEIEFTKKEFNLLKILMEKHGDIVSREEILNIVWGYEYIGETRTVDVHIKELRKKLKNAGIQEKTIETARGIGYKFIL
ncbi:response regulator transcription factor [Candidatus Izemoplasma sp. B36]|uniref:response regulator transcription factor n=1 Tax=Candidatus Izemoplasma sp. B36 TaxID=3242468 RepID=UPI0035592B4C